MRNRKIKHKFLNFSEILPKTLDYNWEFFRLDPFCPYLWNVIHGIINYLPDGVELPKIDTDFDPHYEDPKKLDNMYINYCWKLRMWWIHIERWNLFSLDDLSIELQREMRIQEPEAKRKVAELTLWEGIYSCLNNPQDLPYSIGAEAWQHMQLEDKRNNFFASNNIEDEKNELRAILKYFNYSESSNVNPFNKENFPVQHKMLCLARLISTEATEIRDEFRISYLNPYLKSVSFILNRLRHGFLLPGENELTTYHYTKIEGGIEYMFIGGKKVVVFRRSHKKINLSGRGRKSKKSK